MNHEEALDAICGVQGVTVLSYQEAIEGYLKLRALSPDPTRAVLEECVRAMERVQRFLNFGDGETFNVIGYVDEAIATARNALQGE